MNWITQINWSDPLILLRVYLTILWVIVGLFVLWSAWRHDHKPSSRPLLVYTGWAALTGAASYFIGVLNGSGLLDPALSLIGFLWVAVLLSFTPITLILWTIHAQDIRAKADELERWADDR